METDTTMITAAYTLLPIGVAAVFAYLVYRAVRPQPKKQPVRLQSNYANERLQVRRRGW